MKRKYQFKKSTFQISLIDFTIPNEIKLTDSTNNDRLRFFKYNISTDEISILDLILEDNEIELLVEVCKDLLSEENKLKCNHTRIKICNDCDLSWKDSSCDNCPNCNSLNWYDGGCNSCSGLKN